MFFYLGTPDRLIDLEQEVGSVSEAKTRVSIAILDDNPFSPGESLKRHNFQLVELGPDIRSIDQISSYSIIISDVSGVGRAFGSIYDGAHVVHEIRKAYPDKYLIAYTGMTYSVAITDALSSADKRMEKDASIEAWVKVLEDGISEIINPRKRWIRLRRALLERGLELFDILNLEQAYIKSVKDRDPNHLAKKASSIYINSEIKDMIIKFSATAVASLVGKALSI